MKVDESMYEISKYNQSKESINNIKLYQIVYNSCNLL